MEAFCQSCGMPLTDDVLGTNKDGSKHDEYCKYCYDEGAFQGEMSVEQMADFCAKIMFKEKPDQDLNKLQTETLAFLKTLKRWQ